MADQFYGLTDTGKERKGNEDTFIAQLSVNGRFIIACVIDGVGGYSGGEVAADIARKTILKRLERPAGEVIPILLDCFNQANQKIIAEKKEVKQHDSMACVATLALIDIERNQFHYAHVGDTRLYLLRDSSLVKISHDQSFVGFLEDSGRLTEEAAMTHPKRNEINKALGFESALAKDDDYIETGQSPFLPGDMLLLCSDGLTDMVGKAEITDIINQSNSLQDKCRGLIAAANQHGGKDNITVVLAKNTKQGMQHGATKPASDQKKNKPDSTVEQEAMPAHITVDEDNHHATAKRRNVLITGLALLILIVMGVIIWQYQMHKQPTVVAVNAPSKPVVKPLNKMAVKLQNAVDHLTGKLLLLTDTAYNLPIILSQPIQIKQDTIVIKSSGHIELLSDSGYKGAAFNLSQLCRLVVLDSLTVKNFQTGITGYNQALLLKNLRFINCAMPVQNSAKVPNNQFISGTIATFKADTLPEKPNSSTWHRK